MLTSSCRVPKTSQASLVRELIHIYSVSHACTLYPSVFEVIVPIIVLFGTDEHDSYGKFLASCGLSFGDSRVRMRITANYIQYVNECKGTYAQGENGESGVKSSITP